MFAKCLTTAVVGSALIATAALAQTPSPSTATTQPPAAATSASENTATHQWRASKVVGLKVYNDANESLGSVNDLLIDKDGKIITAVVGVGGFLGVGEHYVAVPFDKIKWVNQPVHSTGSGGMASNSTGMTGRPSSTTTTGAATTAPPAAKPNPWYPDHGVFNATKDQLKSMPEFKYSS